MKFDKWTILSIVEVLLVLACLVFKRVTDDEARSAFLYLQKLSREWSLLTNVTWDRVGNAVAYATYGGYLIITAALLFGKLFEELPTKRRITEWILLGVGAVLFIVLGSLAFASIDSVTPSLVDNAAILGTLSVVTGALFLLDMGAPKAKPYTPPPAQIQDIGKKKNNNVKEEPAHTYDGHRETIINGNDVGRDVVERVYDIEREIDISEDPLRSHETVKGNGERRKTKKDFRNFGIRNGSSKNDIDSKIEMVLKEPPSLPGRSYIHLDPTSKGYKKMRDDDFDIPRRFGIYGRDATDYDTDETASIPPKIELHTPIWANIRKGRDTNSTSNYGVVSFRNPPKNIGPFSSFAPKQ
ncbi:uncharacterized protein LOC126737085 isoform X2 [Anthonomus grandis grandis]|uniref:uncharacterized protein LOC126737085 isoform X2 n=1 Tax=Anthonomus grandis grandis TaxID=2921223 RepID=UPI0021660B1E|nr:uncharacterized protein LOC126737085 isoform X2 [Anthonomus grandis grandis]